ncbi:hypothetical protein [Ramlibacter sp.]|uniref:hypothetical protein n=1 Tax=Ramlibacter sp. TaxID=1917967 RepID=UPI003D13EE74
MGRDRERKDDGNGDGDGQAEGQAPPLTEWIVAGIGLLLVASCIAFLLLHARGADDAVPQPVAAVDGVQASGGGFVARVSVKNDGPAPAARLKLKLTVEGEPGAEPEEREVELQYLPGGSKREAGVFLANDPRSKRVTVEMLSYERP